MTFANFCLKIEKRGVFLLKLLRSKSQVQRRLARGGFNYENRRTWFRAAWLPVNSPSEMNTSASEEAPARPVTNRHRTPATATLQRGRAPPVIWSTRGFLQAGRLALGGLVAPGHQGTDVTTSSARQPCYECFCSGDLCYGLLSLYLVLNVQNEAYNS